MLHFSFGHLQLGIQHIINLGGFDFMLFIVTLIALYKLSEWHKILLLVIAYTIGHSLTLTLASMELISANPLWIDFIIPLTILITGAINLLIPQKEAIGSLFTRRDKLNYLFAWIFGLIHGISFSNFFKAEATSIEHQQMLQELFAFNLGVELGQFIVVLAAVLLSNIMIRHIRLQEHIWTYTVAGSACFLAFIVALGRFPL